MASMTAELARSLFTYEPDTGVLRWRVRTHQKNQVGDVAGTVTKLGYVRVMYKQRCYMGHRVAWAVHHGVWPEKQVDHRNRRRGDNRIANLRLATQAQNARNASAPRDGVSGVRGVQFLASKGGVWRSVVRTGGKTYYFGHHHTFEAAVEARRRGAQDLYGEFAPEEGT